MYISIKLIRGFRLFKKNIPKQNNLVDCGVFVLKYIECIVFGTPVDFNHTDDDINTLRKIIYVRLRSGSFTYSNEQYTDHEREYHSLGMCENGLLWMLSLTDVFVLLAKKKRNNGLDPRNILVGKMRK